SFCSIPDVGFTDWECIHIGAKIAIRNVNGIRAIPKMNFSSPSQFSDVTFFVEGKKIHAHKQYLSVYSKIFHETFFVAENTKNLNEFDIPRVKYEEFVDLLHCIYPSSKKVSVINVGYLLKLARLFQIKFIRDAAVDFLLSSEAEDIMHERIIWYNVYDLNELEDHLRKELSSWDGEEYFGRMRQNSVYTRLAAEEKVKVLEYILLKP
ncbi:hypothetical protein PFISCL1PPCAC_29144, partial [Pristionchus fissidentatus]